MVGDGLSSSECDTGTVWCGAVECTVVQSRSAHSSSVLLCSALLSRLNAVQNSVIGVDIRWYGSNRVTCRVRDCTTLYNSVSDSQRVEYA